MCPTTLLLLAFLLGADTSSGDPTVADIEKAVLGARRTIRSGVVSFELKSTVQNSKRNYDYSATLWFDFDKDKFRSDSVTRMAVRALPAISAYPVPQLRAP